MIMEQEVWEKANIENMLKERMAIQREKCRKEADMKTLHEECQKVEQQQHVLYNSSILCVKKKCKDNSRPLYLQIQSRAECIV